MNWAIVCVIGVGAYLYYSKSGTAKRGRGRISLALDKSSTRDAGSVPSKKGQRKRRDISATRDEAANDVTETSLSLDHKKGKSKGKGRKKRKGSSNKSEAQGSAVETDDVLGGEDNSGDADNDGLDNKEFAKQLSSLKTGTPLAKSPHSNEPGKTKKPGKWNEALPAAGDGYVETNSARNPKDISNASSTTGADGDDDLSSTHSPSLKATPNTQVSGDVSDMLEPKGKGPSVLRLTEPAEPQIIRQAKSQTPIHEKETKKQRQHRRKNEEKKLAREEAEKERRVALEKQLRTAREAEGGPAKNGLNSLNQSSTNAWTKPRDGLAMSSSGTAEPSSSLLDTMDEKPSQGVSTEEQGGSGVPASGKTWERDLPSEEEQMRLLNEMDGNGWSTVKKATKSKKKANFNNGEDGSNVVDNGKLARPSHGLNNTNPNESSTSTNSTTSDSGLDEGQTRSRNQESAANPHEYVRPVIHEKADPNIWNRHNIKEHPDYDPRYPWALIGHPDDSDWAVI